MITEDGSEILQMSKSEAKASVKEMENMMDYFDGICEYCGEQRKNCDISCPSFDDIK